MKKKLIIIISIISIIVTGLAVAGIYFAVELNKKPIKMSGESDIIENEIIIDENTKEPSEYGINDVISMTLWRMKHSNFKSLTTGVSDAGITKQQISNERIVIDNNALITCITYGIVKNATQRYFDDSKVLIRKTSKISNMTPAFPTTDPECISNDEYMIRYGWMPFQATGYIISEETFLEEPTIEKIDDNYKITMKLNPDKDKAPFYYKREVATNASSSAEPIFKEINVEWVIDSKYYILTSTIKEEYSVKAYGFNATSKTNCVEEFQYDDLSFPQDAIDYFSKYSTIKPKEEVDTKKQDSSPLNAITNTFLGKTHNLLLDAKINDISYTGKLKLELESIEDIKLKALINDGLYIEYDKYLYFDYYGLKLKFDVSTFNVDTNRFVKLDDLLDSLINSTMETKDNKIYLSAYIEFSSDSYLTLNFEITEDYNLISCNIDLNILGLNIKLNATDTSNLTFNEYNHDEFVEISASIFNKFITLYENKYINIDLIINVSNTKINANVYLDLEDFIITAKLYINDQIIDLTFIDMTIYLSYNNINVYKSLDDLKLDVSSTVDLILNGELVQYLDSFNIVNDHILIDVKLDTLESFLKTDLSFDIFKFDFKYSILSDIFNVELMLNKVDKKEILLDKTYYDISYLIDCLSEFKDLYKKSYRINYEMDFYVSDKDLIASGYLDLILNNGNYDIYSKLTIAGIPAELEIKNKMVYISISNLKFSLGIDEIKDFASEIISMLEEYDIDINIDLSPVLNNIYINEDNSINIDFGDIIKSIGLMTILINNEDGLNAKINSSLFNVNVDVLNIDDYELIISDDNYLTKEDVIEFVDNILKSYEIIKNNDLELIFNLEVYDSTIKTLDASGKVNLHYYDNYSFDIKASATINEYSNLKLKTIHYADVLYLSNQTNDLIDDYIYADYYNNLDNNHLKVKTSFENVKKMIGDIGNTISINILGELENIDLSSKIDFETLIQSFGLSDQMFNIKLKNIVSDNSIDINYSYDDKIKLSATNIYSKYLDKYNFTRVDIPNIEIYNNSIEFRVDDKGYYDLKDLNLLTEAVKNTRYLPTIKYNGELKLKLFDLITALSLPVSVEMDLDNLKGHVRLDFSDVSLIESALLKPGVLDIYFDTDYIYIHRQNITKKFMLSTYGNEDCYECKITLNTLLENINYYLFEIGFQFGELLMNKVNEGTSGSDDSVINYTKVLNDYSYNNLSFYFNLAIGELANDSTYGDLKFNINASNYDNLVVSSLSNLQFDLLGGLINVKSDEIKLSNVASNKVYDIDLTPITSFIENYDKDIDLVYKNNKLEKTQTHKITYILGLDNNNVIQNGVYKDKLEFPILDSHIIDDKNYLFMGWYYDSAFTNKLDIDEIGHDSINIYAKWVEDTSD